MIYFIKTIRTIKSFKIRTFKREKNANHENKISKSRASYFKLNRIDIEKY